jgi:hypothetical protein
MGRICVAVAVLAWASVANAVLPSPTPENTPQTRGAPREGLEWELFDQNGNYIHRDAGVFLQPGPGCSFSQVTLQTPYRYANGQQITCSGFTPGPTSTPASTATATPVPAATATANSCQASANTCGPTATFTPTATSTATWTATPSATPTSTFTITPTATPTFTPTATATTLVCPAGQYFCTEPGNFVLTCCGITPSATSTPTATATTSATFTPTSTPTATATTSATFTPTATPTSTPTTVICPAGQYVCQVTAEPEVYTCCGLTPSATSTPTSTPSNTATATPTATPSNTAATSTPTQTPTATAACSLTDYFCLAGRAGGQPANCGLNNSDGCAFTSTSGATKGIDTFGTIFSVDEKNGQVGVGNVTPNFDATNTLVLGTSGTASELIEGYGTALFFPILAFQRAQGSRASPTAILSGNVLGIVEAGGHNTSTFKDAAVQIRAQASEGWSTTANGSEWRFGTTLNTTTAYENRFVITNSGHLDAFVNADTNPSIANNDCGTTVQGTVANSTDFVGTVTVGTLIPATCRVTFKNAFVNTPKCFPNPQTTTAVAMLAVPSTTTVTFQPIGGGTFISGEVFDYFCVGRQ